MYNVCHRNNVTKGALWDMGQLCCGIYEIGLFREKVNPEQFWPRCYRKAYLGMPSSLCFFKALPKLIRFCTSFLADAAVLSSVALPFSSTFPATFGMVRVEGKSAIWSSVKNGRSAAATRQPPKVAGEQNDCYRMVSDLSLRYLILFLKEILICIDLSIINLNV